MKKKILSALLLGFFGSLFLVFPKFALAGKYDCSASINFSASPTTITDTQSTTISGTVTLSTSGNAASTNCLQPGSYSDSMPGLGTTISQLRVVIYDEKSSKAILYLTGFNLSGGSNGKSWNLDSKQIGLAELKTSGLLSATSLNLVAIVQATYGSDTSTWNQLTKSTSGLVNITVALSDSAKSSSSASTASDSSSKSSSAAASTASTKTASAALYNPITGVTDLTSLLVKIMKGFLAIIGVLAVAFIIIGGFKMVMANGNEEALLAARKTITWAILGLVIALLSFGVIAIVQNLLGIDVQSYDYPARQVFALLNLI